MSGAAEQQPFRYWAFISYGHADAVAARTLARAIEGYRLPARLSADPKRAFPKRLFPIFRDRDEFSSSADLGVAIAEALKRSRALVVVCSPAAKASRWVNEEIRTFREHHGYERIYAALLDGTPESAFPSQLTAEADRDGVPNGVTHEPLWVDLRPGKETRSDAQLRLIAAILNVDFDALKQRDRARKRLARLRLGGVAVVVLMVAAFAVLSDTKNPLTMALAWKRAAPPPTVHAWSSTEGFTCPSPANCAFETEMVSVSVGGTIAVFGGRTNSDTACAVLPSVQAYDAATNTWRKRTPMPTARTHFAVAAIDGIVYAVGGDVAKSDASGDCVRTNVVEAYDPHGDRWTKKAPLPEARCCFGAAVGTDKDGKEKLYVFGGSGNTGTPSPTVYAYDPTEDRWARKQDLPHPGPWFAGAAVGGRIYAIGRTGGFQRDAVQPYVPAQDMWLENAPKPYSDDYGGSHGLWAGVDYPPGGREWTRPHAAVLGDDISIIEGAAEDSEGASIARIDIFRPSESSWLSSPALPTGPGSVVSIAFAGRTMHVLTLAGPDNDAKSYLKDWSLSGWWLHR